MSDWIDCMNALEPELLEVTIRSEKLTFECKDLCKV